MKVKTSITLSEDVLEELDRVAGSGSRSALIEEVIRSYLRRRAFEAEQQRDLALIEANAEELNEEASDVLEIQAAWLEQ